MRDIEQNKKRRALDSDSVLERLPCGGSTKTGMDEVENHKMDNVNGSFCTLSTSSTTDDTADEFNSCVEEFELAENGFGNLGSDQEEETDIEPPITLVSPHTDFYEQSNSHQVTVVLYVREILEESVKVVFGPKKLSVTFSCQDKKLLEQHHATSRNVFNWTVPLKGQIDPNNCSYSLRMAKLELKMATTSSDKWGSISPIVVEARASKPKAGPNRLPIPLAPPPPPSKSYEASGSSGVDTTSAMCIPKRIVRPGMTGLDNIGNTCFMNSVLQCLINTVELRDYFIEGRHTSEINRDNPLGMGGQIAMAFAGLMKVIWSGECTSYSPSKLKSVMSMRATQFSGFAQHDAQEFMVELLDGIHEDLNRIKKKPYTSEPPDLENMTDTEAADESWRLHRLRNDSIVDDLFKGQFKSTLECPNCSKISVKFDEFRCLSVPIPKESKMIKVLFFWRDTTKLPNQYHIALPATAIAEDLEKRLQQITQVPAKCIELMSATTSKNYRRFGSNMSLGSVSEDDYLMAFEMLNEDDVGGEVIRLVVTQRLMFPNPPKDCASCRRKTPANAKIVRCRKCYRVGYCNATCERAHHKQHSRVCQLVPESVGWPFITSIPRHQATYANVCTVLESYAKFFVDIFQPPVSRGRKHSVDSSGEMSSSSENMDVDSVDSDDLSDSAIDEDSGSPAPSNDSNENVDKLNDNLITESSSSEDLSDKMNGARLFSVQPVTRRRPDQPDFEDQTNGLLNLYNNQELYMDWITKSSLSVRCYVQTKDKIDTIDLKIPQQRSQFKLDLKACIERFTQPERLSDDDSWICPRCKKPVAAIKEMNLWKLPKILLVQLKRFSYRHLIFSDKIDKMVDYPVRGLDLKPFLSNNSVNQSCTYDLYGVVNHMGRLLGGHYTAYCQTPDVGPYGEKIDWRLCDDSRVKFVPESHVVQDLAYLLVYRRREPEEADFSPCSDDDSSHLGACGHSL